MITCPECGMRNGLNALLCTGCGRELPPPTREEPVVISPSDTSTIPMVPVLPPEALLAEAADALADGKADAACNLCRQALEAEPENSSALALLGMAEEERGDLGAALLAYESALELEPDRPIEAHRVSELRRRLNEEIVLEEVAEDRSRRRNEFIDRYTPVFAASAVGIFVLVIGAVLILHVRHANQLRATEAPYMQAMESGKQWDGLKEFANAAQCFQAALAVRPGDPDATTWLNQAQDSLHQSADYAELNRVTDGGKLVPPPPDANPFPPTPIAGTVPPQAGVLMPPAPEPPMFPDAVVGTSRRGSSGPSSRTPRWPTNNANDGGGFLQDGGTGAPLPPPTPTITPGATGGGPVEPRRSSGNITISMADVPERTPRAATTEEDPSQYRQQADALRRQGDRQGAVSAYHKAIQATQNSSQNPALKKAAVDSMRKALDVLEGSGR